jgi:exodeoxyribonuclease VII small subunit
VNGDATNDCAEGAATPASFEDALRELQRIAARLEDGSAGLEASLQEFERGIGLLRVCYQRLEAAEQKVEQLVRIEESGAVVVAPFDAAATVSQPGQTAGKRRASKPATGSLLPEDPTGRE